MTSDEIYDSVPTMRTTKGKLVVQRHHIVYASPDHPEQELTVRVGKGEHLILGKLNLYTRRRISRGLIKALKVFVAMNEDRATDF